MFKRTIISLLLLFAILVGAAAQEQNFKCQIYNKEYDVSLILNLYEEAITIPGQEVLGKVYGYLKKPTDSRAWVIMGAKVSPDDKKAKLEIVNDYGSEDLEATITLQRDGSYMLTQEEGSTIKVASKGKWVKIPKNIVFLKSNQTFKG